MKPFEEELKDALRRVEPPAGFAERVLDRAGKKSHSRPSLADWFRALFRPRPVRWAAAFGLACLLAVIGTESYRQHQQARIQGEIAGAQARLALQIASTKLNAVLKDAARTNRHNLEN
jgi:hypothetical protein